LKTTFNILLIMLSLSLLYACQSALWPFSHKEDASIEVTVERYDRLQGRYLTTGDFSALQSMNTTYPMETRMLIENILQLGTVNQQDINEKFLKFYQDTTLQGIINEVQTKYADMDDINASLSQSFTRLQRIIPGIHIPVIYSQIGALDQSIIVGDSAIGICLDKYLGKNYQPYLRFYPEHQRQTMTRDNIVPDVLTFYILSLYQLPNFESASQEVRDDHIARVFYVVNKALGKRFFTQPNVKKIELMMKKNPNITIQQLLRSE